jgi:hypothetical protein
MHVKTAFFFRSATEEIVMPAQAIHHLRHRPQEQPGTLPFSTWVHTPRNRNAINRKTADRLIHL